MIKKRIFVFFAIIGLILFSSLIQTMSTNTEDKKYNISYCGLKQSGSELTPLYLNPSIESDMGLNELISDGFSGKNITIAILDTGIMYSDIRFDEDGDADTVDDRIVTNHVSFVNGEPDYDLNGHGTTIAGLLSARLSYISSIDFSFCGMAQDVKLWSVKVLDKDGYGDEISIVQGLQYCLSHSEEIDIINLSFGLIKTSENEETLNQIEEIVVQCWDAGMVVVSAAGNEGNALTTDGTSLYSISSPSSVLEIISVGATTEGGIADFSSIGPSLMDYYAKPDLVAPGANLITTDYRSDTFAIGVAGTSYSSPIIAGGIAILLEACSDINPSPDLIKSSLVDSCQSLGYTLYEEGAGLPNFTKALEYLTSEDFDGISTFPDSLSFPNFFDPEKESLPQNTHGLYPEINFEKILITLIVGKTPKTGIRVTLDDDIEKFIEINDIAISETGQYIISVDFIESMIVKGSLFFFKPGMYEGYLRIYDGENEVDNVYISVEITFLALVKVWWGLSLFTLIPFIALLTIWKKKRTIPKSLSNTCPKGFEKYCKCNIDGSYCYVDTSSIPVSVSKK